MCSVLLIFLVFVVAFDLAKDSVPNWISAQALQTGAQCCQTCLVPTPHRCGYTGQFWPLEIGEETLQSPFTGFTVFETHQKARQDDTRALALEMHELSENQQEDGHGMCTLPFSLDNRYTSSNPASSADLSRLDMGSLGNRRQDLESTEGSVEIAIKILQPKKSHEGERREKSSQGQEDQGWRRQESCIGQTCAFPICTLGSGNATMASTGGCNLQSSSCLANSTDSTDRCTKSGSRNYAQECILRDQSYATGSERVYREIGKRKRQRPLPKRSTPPLQPWARHRRPLQKHWTQRSSTKLDGLHTSRKPSKHDNPNYRTTASNRIPSKR